MNDSKIEQVVIACDDVLSRSPGGLFTDFDGTLSHVAPKPEAAELAPGAGAALKDLVHVLDTVAIVTGRAAADAVSRVGVDGLTVVGNHGLEQIVDGVASIDERAREQIDAVGAAVDMIEYQLRNNPLREFLVIENKRLSASIHYRLAADPDAAYQTLIDLASEQAQLRNLVITEGKLVIELRPSIEVNKGTAVSRLVKSRGLRGAVMLGDDITDVDAFMALRRQRNGDLAAAIVAVISSDTPAAVIDAADFHLNGVSECVQLLQQLAERLTRSAR